MTRLFGSTLLLSLLLCACQKAPPTEESAAPSAAAPMGQAQEEEKAPVEESAPPALIAEGSEAPDFAFETFDGKSISLADLRGKPVVLYFYPKDSTPGCTQEGRDFTALNAKFKRQKTVILGVSRDSLASHEKFKAKQKFPFDLLSDADEKLCKKFDVIKEKSLYGRKFMGVERSTFLIDANGKLRREWRKVKVKGHAAEGLEAVKELA